MEAQSQSMLLLPSTLASALHQALHGAAMSAGQEDFLILLPQEASCSNAPNGIIEARAAPFKAMMKVINLTSFWVLCTSPTLEGDFPRSPN